MPVDSSSSFATVIQEHLELKQRNSRLETVMPLYRYKAADPFDNHPLFKTEEQARLEETMDGPETILDESTGAIGEETAENERPALDDSLWSRSRDFDWGD